jgi:hemerythrin
MALFDWKEEYSVGVPTIDEQHKKLIAIINRLHEAMLAGSASKVMDGIFAELLDYTVYHFSTEEKLFQQHQYPQTSVHTNKHIDLTKTAQQLQSDFASGKTRITLDTMNFLKDWLNDHILQVDKQAGAFLASKGVR